MFKSIVCHLLFIWYHNLSRIKYFSLRSGGRVRCDKYTGLGRIGRGGERESMPLETSAPNKVARELSLCPVSYKHPRANETVLELVCRLLLEKKKTPIETGCTLIMFLQVILNLYIIHI